jgi:hypothetical protein
MRQEAPMLPMPTPDDAEPTMLRGPEAEDAAAVNAWLRAELGRRLTVGVLEAHGDEDDACAHLCERLALYPEVRVLRRASPVGAARDTLLAQLGELVREDADALLVWVPAAALALRDGASVPERLWAGDVLACADELDLRDRCFTALIGEDMTRQDARKAGYEDGFPADISLAALVRALGREALQREFYRRRGSSPPCYL